MIILFFVGIFLNSSFRSGGLFGDINSFIFSGYIERIFRSMYLKLAIFLVLPAAFLMGYSIENLYHKISNRYAKYIFVVMFMILFLYFEGSSFFDGKIIKSEGNVFPSYNVKIPKEYYDLNAIDGYFKLDGRYVAFPLSRSYNNVLKWDDGGFAGGDFLRFFLNGKSLVYQHNNNKYVNQIKESVLTGKQDNTVEILKLSNIKYIFRHDDFDSRVLVDGNAAAKDFEMEKIENNNFVNILSTRYFEVSAVRNDDFLPHFYTPQNFVISGRDVDSLLKIISSDEWQTRSAVFFAGQNVGKEGELGKISNQNQSVNSKASDSGKQILRQAQDAKVVAQDDKKLPTMEFKKINPTKYRIRIHQAQGTFPLIFSESFNEGWKMYLEKYGGDSLPTGRQVAIRENDMLANYKILDGNVDDQASASELQDYINNNYITTLGDQTEKTIEHAKWGPSTGSGYEEKYRIDFISKNFQGTIQNDNLPNGNIFETWLKKPIENNRNHLMANGYANSWVVDADAICVNDSAKCIKNADGSYDFEILVEFWPQRLFYVGLAISLTTLLGCILYLGYDWRKRRKQKKLDPKII